MSLINKMLQDLDARGNARAGDVPLAVKPVPSGASSRPRRRIAAITAALLAALGLGVAAWVFLPIKGKTFDARPPAPAPVAQAILPAASEPAPVTVAEVAPVASPPAPAPAPAETLAAPDDSAPQAPASEPEEAAPPRARAAAPAVAKSAAPAASTTTWAVASARARAEQERLAQRWAAEEARIAAMPPGERAAATRRLRAEQEKAAQKARADAAWVAALKRKESAAGGLPGEGDASPASQVQGRSETALQRADNSYRRALASLQDGRVAEAIAGLQAALRANPKHDAARQTLVGLLIESRRNDEAVAELQQGLALDARQPALAMLLARLQIERGGSGIETLLRTLPYAAGNGEYHGFLAGAMQRQGRHREAAEQYQVALRSAPDNAVWWMGLGISLQAEKRNAEALDAFRKARDSGALSQELQGFVERRIAQLAR